MGLPRPLPHAGALSPCAALPFSPTPPPGPLMMCSNPHVVKASVDTGEVLVQFCHKNKAWSPAKLSVVTSGLLHQPSPGIPSPTVVRRMGVDAGWALGAREQLSCSDSGLARPHVPTLSSGLDDLVGSARAGAGVVPCSSLCPQPQRGARAHGMNKCPCEWKPFLPSLLSPLFLPPSASDHSAPLSLEGPLLPTAVEPEPPFSYPARTPSPCLLRGLLLEDHLWVWVSPLQDVNPLRTEL